MQRTDHWFITFFILYKYALTKTLHYERLLIRAIVQSANHMAAGCNVNIKQQKWDGWRWFWHFFGARRVGLSVSVTTDLLGFSHTWATNTLLMREVRLELTGHNANSFNCALQLWWAEKHLRIHNTLTPPPPFGIAFLICLPVDTLNEDYIWKLTYCYRNMQYYSSVLQAKAFPIVLDGG